MNVCGVKLYLLCVFQVIMLLCMCWVMNVLVWKFVCMWMIIWMLRFGCVCWCVVCRLNSRFVSVCVCVLILCCCVLIIWFNLIVILMGCV